MSVPIAVIAAVADNGVIGCDNRLIWRLKSDLRRFRSLTFGKPLLMGRLTYESIGRPLPGRETVVLSTDRAFDAPGVQVARTVPEATALGRALAARLAAGEIMVAGGAAVYAQFLPLADRLYLTRVHTEPAGDALFPDFERSAFRETMREDHDAGPDDEFPFTFVEYVRMR